MGEKGNMLDTASLTGLGLGSANDVVGTAVDKGETGSSGSHGLGVAHGAAKIATQQLQDQLADEAGQLTTVEGLPLGMEKPSASK